jgi:hypothetical protein
VQQVGVQKQNKNGIGPRGLLGRWAVWIGLDRSGSSLVRVQENRTGSDGVYICCETGFHSFLTCISLSSSSFLISSLFSLLPQCFLLRRDGMVRRGGPTTLGGGAAAKNLFYYFFQIFLFQSPLLFFLYSFPHSKFPNTNPKSLDRKKERELPFA